MKLKKILVTIVALSVIGCVKIPVVERPPIILSGSSKENNVDIDTNISQDIVLDFKSDKWWTALDDNSLNSIMDLVLKNNKTLEISKLNIKKAEEGIDLARAGRGLDVSLGGDSQEIYSHDKFSNLSQIGLQTSYDVDLFGKVGNLIKQQEYQKSAVELSSKQVELNLSYQVTKIYAYWLYLQTEEQNLLQRRNTLSEIEKMEKNKMNLEKGTKDSLLVIQELENNTDILIETNKSNKNIVKNTLYNLVGSINSKDIDQLLAGTQGKDFFAIVKNIQISSTINSDVIRNRPDIQYYMEIIKSQESKLDALKTTFYPSFSIGGKVSYSTLNIADLFTSNGILGLIKPSVYLPVLDSGKIKSNYKIAGIDLNIFIEQYNRAVLDSYKDINEKLLKYNSEVRIHEETMSNLNIKQEVLNRSKKRMELEKSSKREYTQDYYNYLVYRQSNEQEKYVMLNYKIDLVNSIGGLYTK